MSARRALLAAAGCAALAPRAALAQSAEAPPFRCASMYVEPASRYGSELASALQGLSLSPTPMSEEADLRARLEVHYNVTFDEVRHTILASQKITFKACLKDRLGAEDCAGPASYELPFGAQYRPMGEAAAVRRYFPTFVKSEFLPIANQFIRERRFGVRLVSDPPGATIDALELHAGNPPVRVANLPGSDLPRVIGCLPKGTWLHAKVIWPGFAPERFQQEAREKDVPATLRRAAPDPVVQGAATSSSGSGTGGGNHDDGNGGFRVWMLAPAALLAGLGALIYVLRRRPEPAPRPAPSHVEAAPRVRVLFVAANPKGTSWIHLDQEIRQIKQKILEAKYRDRLDFVELHAAEPQDLIRAFNEHRPHVVHFSGHGGATDGLILHHPEGGPVSLGADDLVALFTVMKDDVQLVVLNACYSEALAGAVTRVIDCAVGSDGAIGDDAAIQFAGGFYGAIAFGRSVKDACEQGRLAIRFDKQAQHDEFRGVEPEDGAAPMPEHMKPKLKARAGVDPARLVLLPATEGADLRR